MRIVQYLTAKAYLLSQSINDDVAVAGGGIGGGIYSYFTNTRIIELLDFSIHAIVGGLISYGLKHGFELVMGKKKKQNEQGS